MKLTLLYFDGSPHWADADRLLAEIAKERENVVVERRIVDTPQRAVEEEFRGSPTILVDGVDPFTDPDARSDCHAESLRLRMDRLACRQRRN